MTPLLVPSLIEVLPHFCEDPKISWHPGQQPDLKMDSKRLERCVVTLCKTLLHDAGCASPFMHFKAELNIRCNLMVLRIVGLMVPLLKGDKN